MWCVKGWNSFENIILLNIWNIPETKQTAHNRNYFNILATEQNCFDLLKYQCAIILWNVIQTIFALEIDQMEIDQSFWVREFLKIDKHGSAFYM